jgi:hypothetical protein
MTMILLFFLTFNFVTPDMNIYRGMMDNAVENKTAALKFYAQMKNVNENDAPILMGFRSMSEFLMCKHLTNPFSRMSHFNKGKELLEMAINRAKDNPELLLFRLTTQNSIPSILKYNTHISEDKAALISYLKRTPQNEDMVLYQRVKKYLLSSKKCSAEEIALIKTL